MGCFKKTLLKVKSPLKAKEEQNKGQFFASLCFVPLS
jgi:hypothetical protein